MRTIEGENELLLTCAEAPDGVSILRCETRDDDVRLPDEIGGAPVVSLGTGPRTQLVINDSDQ